MIQNNIVQEICAYVEKGGGAYSGWYCGIASSPEKRLFKDHNVSESECWIFCNAKTEQDARDTESYLAKLGFQGGNGEGGPTAVSVYVYKITDLTREAV